MALLRLRQRSVIRPRVPSLCAAVVGLLLSGTARSEAAPAAESQNDAIVVVDKAGDSRSPAKSHASSALSRPEYVRAPDCLGNDPSTGRIDTCANVTGGCFAPQVRVRVWSAPPGTAVGSGRWTAGPPFCSDPVRKATPVLSVEEFRRLPLPAGVCVVQPPGADVLIRMPTNAYASSVAPVELATTLLGQSVGVRATPASWTFEYGDGGVVGPSKDPGGPYPRLTTAHSYVAAGTYTITMTTHYFGEYSVAGGAWQRVDGLASVTGSGHTVTARTATPRLIAGGD